MKLFQDVEGTTIKKLRKLSQITSADVIFFGVDSGNTNMSYQIDLNAEKSAELSGVNIRNSALLELETHINELNEMVKDLAVIIQDHGSMVDTIEDHVHSQ